MDVREAYKMAREALEYKQGTNAALNPFQMMDSVACVIMLAYDKGNLERAHHMTKLVENLTDTETKVNELNYRITNLQSALETKNGTIEQLQDSLAELRRELSGYKENKPCRQKLINDGAAVIPRSCPRCGLTGPCHLGLDRTAGYAAERREIDISVVAADRPDGT